MRKARADCLYDNPASRSIQEQKRAGEGSQSKALLGKHRHSAVPLLLSLLPPGLKACLLSFSLEALGYTLGLEKS